MHSASKTDSVLLVQNVLGSQTPKEEWLYWESRSVTGECVYAREREGEREREQEHENMPGRYGKMVVFSLVMVM